MTRLKRFQSASVDSAVLVLGACLRDVAQLRGSSTFEAGRRLVVAHQGALLFEAPTGTGKTLMAGATIERLSLSRKVLWFWFAPFSGLVDQTANTLRREFPGLRVRNPTVDRNADTLESGDVFVTTWASVAVANVDSRRIRQATETAPSLDALLGAARALGYHVGVVIDEAHHSFRGQNQAFAFYQDVLAPDVTLLATATPRDHDVDGFVRRNGLKHLHRITVSRQQGVEARLIKEGVKVAVFRADKAVAELVDFRRTALEAGVATHDRLKAILASAGLDVKPLLLVQADSLEASIETVERWLQELGLRPSQVRSHTAEEPDPHLLALAHDEEVEALVFKMAVATGFDAPRAFTLVSMRSSRDPDFGVQIVGRILRVDRRLQALHSDDVPEALRYGYVFLSDRDSQAGLATAAQRINAIRDELAEVSTNVSVVALGESGPVAQSTPRGQTTLLPQPEERTSREAGDTSLPVPSWAGAHVQSLLGAMGLEDLRAPPAHTAPPGERPPPSPAKAPYRYPLRTDLGAPARFKKAVISLDQGAILGEVVGRFRFDSDALMVAQRTAARILMEQTEIFAGRVERPDVIQSRLAQQEINKRAQLCLFKADLHEVLSARDLFTALQEELRAAFERAGLAPPTGEELRNALNKILVLKPGALQKAVSEAVALHVTTADTDSPLPAAIESAEELQPSRLNLYGVYPPLGQMAGGINTWERAFAEEMDADLSGTVRWWHRNPSRQPHSVSLPLPGQPGFYPDFVVGVHGRTRGEGILLVEVKHQINDPEGNAAAKAISEHQLYRKVMMLHWEKEERWMVVAYDESTGKNVLGEVFRIGLMPTY